MKKLLLVSALLSCCGSGKVSDLDIVGGRKVYRQFYGRLEVGGGFRCGSTLIKKQWAITAAHCFNYKPIDPKRVKVRLGAFDLNKPNNAGKPFQLMQVKEMFIHPQWDLALLKFDRNAKFRPIPYGHAAMGDGQPLQTYGFGNKAWGVPGGNILRGVTLRFIKQDRAPHMIHATGGIGKGVCHGDSGGPLVFRKDGRPMLVGVTSWTGSKCASKKGPSGFAKVDVYWINKTINNEW